MKISMPIQGGCACGAVRYQAAMLPLFVFQCHCRDCQRATGSPYAVNVWFWNSEIAFNEEPKNYLVQADLGRDVHHYFCEKCGSPLGMQPVGSEVRGVRAASLDDPGWLVPMANVWTCRSYPWEEMSTVLRNYETQPKDEEWPSVFKAQADVFRSRGIVAAHDQD